MASKTVDYDVDVLPPARSIEALLAERVKKFASLKKQTAASKIRSVYLRTNQIIGVGFVGDPHLDDDGTDIKKAFEHATLFNGSNPGLYGALLGDITNSWVGRLERLWAEQSTTATDALQLTEHYLKTVKWLFAVHGNHDCVDDETEALTKRGWMKYSDIRMDDQVLGFNPDTECAEWQPILGMVSRENSEEMYHTTTQSLDMMVTPNHRVLNHLPHGNPWRYSKMKDLTPGNQYNLKVAAIVNQPDAPFYDDELRLAAWLLTDSHRTPRGYWSLYQSKPDRVEEIRNLLARLGISHSERVREKDRLEIGGVPLKSKTLPSFTFRFHASAREYCDTLVPDRTVLPDWVLSLSKRQFDVFLHSLIAADGTWRPYNQDGTRCARITKSPRWISSFQAVAVCFGYRVSVTKPKPTYHVATISEATEVSFVPKVSTKVVASTPHVWCLAVPLTNFMVRRNGKAHFTGNCWDYRQVSLLEYLLASQTSITAKHEQRVKLIFPNKRELLIHARHKFPGSSMYLKQFGQVKAAYTGSADIYVGADLHVAGYSFGWNETQQKAWHAVQVASYKEIDEYPIELGLTPANLFQCPVAIIDPKATTPTNFVRWEFDPHEGAKRLKWERARR